MGVHSIEAAVPDGFRIDAQAVQNRRCILPAERMLTAARTLVERSVHGIAPSFWKYINPQIEFQKSHSLFPEILSLLRKVLRPCMGVDREVTLIMRFSPPFFCLYHCLLVCSLIQFALTLPYLSSSAELIWSLDIFKLLRRMSGVSSDASDGWTMYINDIGCFMPFHVATEDLLDFYFDVLLTSLTCHLDESPRSLCLHYTYGLLSLTLEQSDWIGIG